MNDAMSKCYKCGTKTGRRARLDEHGNLNEKFPFVPVCYECGPKYTITGKLTKEGLKSLSIEDMNDLKNLGNVIIPELN